MLSQLFVAEPTLFHGHAVCSLVIAEQSPGFWQGALGELSGLRGDLMATISVYNA